MIDIRPSNVGEMLANAGTMFEKHWDEIALNKRVMVLKPDEDRYRAMEKAGTLLILAAWENDCLIGYSVNFIINHLHYADLKVCSNDLLFITKEKRNSRVGIKLIHETEKQAAFNGAQLMLWHAKPDTALSVMMPKMGYGVQDIIFSKEI